MRHFVKFVELGLAIYGRHRGFRFRRWPSGHPDLDRYVRRCAKDISSMGGNLFRLVGGTDQRIGSIEEDGWREDAIEELASPTSIVCMYCLRYLLTSQRSETDGGRNPEIRAEYRGIGAEGK